MTEPLVIGLDSSTQSTKAIAWNARGKALAEGRADIPMQNPQLNYFEQRPDDWWTSCTAALRNCTEHIDPARVQGLAISNQRETLAFVDANGAALHPAIVWLDERARDEVKTFSEAFGAENIHRITGRPVDVTPCLYRFLWMKKHRPDVYAATACFADVQAYLVQRLCGGGFRTGWISADPMGLYDLVRRRWSSELLDALGPRHQPFAAGPGAGLAAGDGSARRRRPPPAWRLTHRYSPPAATAN